MKESTKGRTTRGNERSMAGRISTIACAVALTAFIAGSQVAASPAAARVALAQGSVWDSVFSLAQAGRGESTYKNSCATCHGDSLAGVNDAPPLTGTPFHKNWDGNALSMLFNRISNDMPSDNPGSLTKPQVAELIAYLLKYNGYPAGNNDLPAAPESLSQVRFTAKP